MAQPLDLGFELSARHALDAQPLRLAPLLPIPYLSLPLSFQADDFGLRIGYRLLHMFMGLRERHPRLG